MLPVIGALIGGIAGGPIGLVFGLKIGAAAALGGGIAGFAGGGFLKRKGDKNVDTELQNLSSNKETSIVKKHL
jgi:syntaxin 17